MSGSSTVLIVCGFCISFGVYTSRIQEANNNIIQVGQQKSYYTEARLIASAGLNHALAKMANPSWFNHYQVGNKVTVNNLACGGDRVSYVIDKNGLPSNEARVTVTATFGGVTARQVAVIIKSPTPTYYWYQQYNKKDGMGNLYSTWKVKQVYLYPYQFTES